MVVRYMRNSSRQNSSDGFVARNLVTTREWFVIRKADATTQLYHEKFRQIAKNQQMPQLSRTTSHLESELHLKVDASAKQHCMRGIAK